MSRHLKKNPGIRSMKILCVWFFIILPASCSDLTGPGQVSGYQGERLTVQCNYMDKYVDKQKYWCKENRYRPCSKVVTTTENTNEVKEGRVSIKDDTTNRIFTVTIDDLRDKDAGDYGCGIAIIWLDPYSKVEVAVLPVSTTLKPTTSVKTTSSFMTQSIATFSRTAYSFTTSTFKGKAPGMETSTHSTSSSSSSSEPSSTGKSESVLLFLIPAVVLLMLLLLLVAVLFVRAQRKRKQDTSQDAAYNYAIVQFSNRPPQTEVSTIYTDVKMSGVTQYSEVCSNTGHSPQSYAADNCYEDITEYPQESVGQTDVSYATLQFKAQDPHQEIYTNVKQLHSDPSEECQYSLVKQ